MLSNVKNKANLADFLLRDWIAKLELRLKPAFEVYLAGGFHDINRAVKVVLGGHSEVPELGSDHEEADSRMFIHIAHGRYKLGVNRVVLWCLDTDVAAMCPRYCRLLGLRELYLKTGVRQKKRFIPMHDVANELGDSTSQMLPAIHAASGCDSTSAFFGIGKQRWLNLIEEHPELHNGLCHLGTVLLISTLKLRRPLCHSCRFCTVERN